MVRHVKVEAFDVVGYDTIVAEDVTGMVNTTISTLNRALEDLAPEFRPGSSAEAITMTITLEVDIAD